MRTSSETYEGWGGFPHFSEGKKKTRSTRQKVSDLIRSDEALIADLKGRLLPQDTPHTDEANREYLRENIPTRYFVSELTTEQLRGASFRDPTQPNVVMDDRGILLNIIMPYGHESHNPDYKIIDVHESRMGQWAISRKFGTYLSL